MADITKAALRNRVLEKLGIIAAGQTPESADQTLVEEAIDAAHEELRKSPGVVPFATSAIPSWAQLPMRDWVVAAVGQSYGQPWTDDEVEQRKALAERRLSRQVAGYKHNLAVRFKSY